MRNQKLSKIKHDKQAFSPSFFAHLEKAFFSILFFELQFQKAAFSLRKIQHNNDYVPE